ncbi:MAG: right-handed parallel beta-helix repeat-containing protein [Lachnospiraceae bacterium]|nr:right-handed parallel beta-helix repeat-containing protein [Lachnospiraceae bacterium]
MLLKKKAAVLIIALTLIITLIIPAAKTDAAYFPYTAGDIVYSDDGVSYEVLWISEGKRSVLIYNYPDVNVKSLSLPNTVYAGGYEWMVIGASSGAFKNCTTPKTIEIPMSTNINWYYMCPDAFINGSKQTIKVNAPDGEWDNLRRILEFNGPTPVYLASNVPSTNNSSYKTVTNTEDTLYVTVPSGTYTLVNSKQPEKGAELRVYSNTTLNLKGVTFKRNNTSEALSSHMLSLGTTGLKLADGTTNAKGYGGGSNIKILYGTFDNGTTPGANNICRGSHLSNITIQGTTFKYLPDSPLTSGMINSHCIELAGVKKVTIKSCKFYNNSNCKFDNEAVQIESCGSDPTAQAHTNVAAPLDDTQTSNVTITKCTFDGFNYGCGSNHLSVNDCYKNMKFTSNKFYGCQKYCICLYNYDKVTISSNKMYNCSTLVLDPSDHKSTNVTIKKNKKK